MWAWLKRAFGGATGLCVPDQSQNVTLTPPNGLNQQHAGSFSASTPLPLGYNKAGAINSSSRDTQAEPDKTPEDPAAPHAGRYIVSAKGMPVGIANTVSRYRENQPVRTHLTPFEQRVAAKLTEEQQIAAAAAAKTDDSSSDGGSSAGHVAQELFATGTPSAASK